MKNVPCSRRAFLRGAGGIALALPYLDRFAGLARAQSAAPLRLVVVMHGQGMLMDRWTPSTTGSDFALSEILAPLAAQRDKLLVLSGIDNAVRLEIRRGNGHNPAGRSLMTCWPFAASVNADGTVKAAAQQVENGPAFGPSIEHVIAGRIGGGTRFPRFDLKVGARGLGENQVFWAENQVPIEAQGDPAAAYARLVSAIEPAAAAEPTLADRMRQQRGSVLDTVLDGFRGLMRDVGSADKARLEAHAMQIRALEHNLAAGTAGASCTPHAQALPSGFDFESRDSDGAASPAMIDNLVLALACDLTRVATLQFADYHAPTFSWLDVDVPGAWENWHELVHLGGSDPGSRAAMIGAQQWYAAQFAYLLERMQSVVEQDGTTLLDNTLVLWISEFGNGGAHDTRNLPVVLAGGGGRIGTGRHLDLSGRTTGDLFTTLLQHFGGDDQGFGLLHKLDGSSLVSGPLDLG